MIPRWKRRRQRYATQLAEWQVSGDKCICFHCAWLSFDNNHAKYKVKRKHCRTKALHQNSVLVNTIEPPDTIKNRRDKRKELGDGQDHDEQI